MLNRKLPENHAVAKRLTDNALPRRHAPRQRQKAGFAAPGTRAHQREQNCCRTDGSKGGNRRAPLSFSEAPSFSEPLPPPFRNRHRYPFFGTATVTPFSETRTLPFFRYCHCCPFSELPREKLRPGLFHAGIGPDGQFSEVVPEREQVPGLRRIGESVCGRGKQNAFQGRIRVVTAENKEKNKKYHPGKIRARAAAFRETTPQHTIYQ